jgi:hypothetical protein
MPLRDHFRSPVNDYSSWEELHGMWPAVIVQQLKAKLPAGFVAVPRVHFGSQAEIDVAAFERGGGAAGRDAGDGGTATAVWAPAEPSVAVETELPDYDEYEVRVRTADRHRRLVAAVEIVSPGNKDRPEKRNAFVAKCAALLQQGVAVSVVDLVTVRQFNLYAELLALIGHADPTLGDPPPATYAASCRWVRRGEPAVLEAWSYPLAVGSPLPTALPIWLTPTRAVPLDLEASYEKACDDVSIP